MGVQSASLPIKGNAKVGWNGSHRRSAFAVLKGYDKGLHLNGSLPCTAQKKAPKRCVSGPLKIGQADSRLLSQCRSGPVAFNLS
jgi:hypothetical protein